MTLNSTNKYYNPMGQKDLVYIGRIKINNIQNDDALIEILYSLGENSTEILNDRAVTDKEISKYVTFTIHQYYCRKNERHSKKF